MKYFALLGAVLFAVVSCGTSDHGKIIDEAAGGRTGSAGHNGSGAGNPGTGGDAGSDSAEAGEAGAAGSVGTFSVLAPVIALTAPVAATDPNVDLVLVDAQVTALCTVTASTDPSATKVNATSVKLAMLDTDGMSLKSVAGTPTANANEYSAVFALAGVENGRVSFQCSASDTSNPAHQATANVKTFVDHGPTVAALVPLAGSAHSLQGPMNVEFTVSPAPLTDSDKQAGVTGVSLAVGGTKIPIAEKGAGKYQASVDFTDKALFTAPPSGPVPVLITASNGRKNPGKATNSNSYDVIVDGIGPVITLNDPGLGAVVGRASVLHFTVADPGSGVDPSTITVNLNDSAFVYSAKDNKWGWNATTGVCSFNMGAQLLKSTDTQVTVNLKAADNAGNTGTNSRLYNLDNTPPVVDLDPQRVFETRPGSDGGVQCSDFFDPLGDGTQAQVYDPSPPQYAGSPDDQTTITNFGRFRALVWDETNTKAGVADRFYALTDKDSVRIYVQPNPSLPLLADDDGDGKCDEIWTGSAPHQKNSTDKPLPFLALKPLTPTGSAAWGMGTTPVPSNVAMCAAGVDSPFVRLCGPTGLGESDMSIVIRHPVPAPFEPVIYAVEPSTSPVDSICAGKQWDVPTAISMAGLPPKLGWVCIAARALDAVGNPGISAPLRVCLDDSSNRNRCLNVPAPSCVDNGCTPPAHFRSREVRHN